MSATSIRHQATRCTASLLGRELIRVAEANTHNPRLVVLALGSALGSALAHVGPGAVDQLLREAMQHMGVAIRSEQMDLRLQEAGILAVHEGGNA